MVQWQGSGAVKAPTSAGSTPAPTPEMSDSKLFIVPVTFREASEFVGKLHRHNKPPRGCKFCIGVVDELRNMRGVAQCGRPIARALDDGLTLEINRTCTDGCRNANSALYGACRIIAKGMGYRRIITYTQADETGASLRGAGFVRVKDLPPRKGWADSTKTSKVRRDPVGTGGVARVLWEIRFNE